MTHWTLVTGGAKGLGAEICLTLAAEGYPLVIHYRSSREEAEKVAAECRQLGVEAECLQGDFSSLETTRQFIEAYRSRFPSTANLINNVGNYLIKSAGQTTLEEWYSLFQTNLHAPYELIQALLPSI